jgi:hypothetical protein
MELEHTESAGTEEKPDAPTVQSEASDDCKRDVTFRILNGFTLKTAVDCQGQDDPQSWHIGFNLPNSLSCVVMDAWTRGALIPSAAIAYQPSWACRRDHAIQWQCFSHRDPRKSRSLSGLATQELYQA